MGPIVQRDESGVPRHVSFPYAQGARAQTLLALTAYADDFLIQQGHLLALPESALRALRQPIASLPENEASALRAETEKQVMDTHVVGYAQTYFGLPVVGAGVSVTVRDAPRSVLAASSTLDHDLRVVRPSDAQVTRAVQRFMPLVGQASHLAALGLADPGDGLTDQAREVRVHQSRLVVFRYHAKQREGEHPAGPDAERLPWLPLPPLAAAITEGAAYVAVELYFTARSADYGRLNWLMYVDVATLSVLQLLPLVDHAFASVFLRDPITKGSGVSPSSNSEALNPLRDAVQLQGLVPPREGTQSLRGEYVQIADTVPPSAPVPTAREPFEFGYDARTDNFAAANAYFQCDRFFRLVHDLGFDVKQYFDGTRFPVVADHRGFGANTINARCPGNTTGTGIGTLEFALADLSDVEHPLGIAADWRVVLHELGGHGILWDHVSRPNFGFAHSAGDTFAAVLNDPGSSAPDRFVTFPWIDIGRRHDRTLSEGWGWGGFQDVGGYASEQIVSTTLFRVYRALGGDGASLPQRERAARTLCYLVLRAVALLTPGTNPDRPLGLEAALEAADAGVWTPNDSSEAYAGGAYHKLIRWAFEKQGLFRARGVPSTSEGAPPEVDVYIDDGRRGEYTFQPRPWTCMQIWNRRAPDAGDVHQEPLAGHTNYAYVRIANRGTQTASGVHVSGFHARPGMGWTYPDDWRPLSTPQLSAADLAATQDALVGPFEWTPEHGHAPLLFSVSADDDPSHLEAFVTGPIADWRLIPHDNNLAVRSVHLLPLAIAEALPQRKLWVKNPFAREVTVVLAAALPELLTSRGYQLQLGPALRLAPAAEAELSLTLTVGSPLSRAELPADPDARSLVIMAEADGIPIGGVSFVIDPDLAS